MKNYLLVLQGFIITILLTSCDRIEWLTYTNEKAGFTISYPKHWQKISASESAAMESKGKKILEEVVGDTISILHENLLEVKADFIHTFTSNMQAYHKEDGPYDELQNEVFLAVLKAYDMKGIPYDHERFTVILDGLEFQSLHIRLYSKDRKKTILQQQIYDRLFEKKFSIMFSITYNSSGKERILREMLSTAKFKYRN